MAPRFSSAGEKKILTFANAQDQTDGPNPPIPKDENKQRSPPGSPKGSPRSPRGSGSPRPGSPPRSPRRLGSPEGGYPGFAAKRIVKGDNKEDEVKYEHVRVGLFTFQFTNCRQIEATFRAPESGLYLFRLPGQAAESGAVVWVARIPDVRDVSSLSKLTLGEPLRLEMEKGAGHHVKAILQANQVPPPLPWGVLSVTLPSGRDVKEVPVKLPGDGADNSGGLSLLYPPLEERAMFREQRRVALLHNRQGGLLGPEAGQLTLAELEARNMKDWKKVGKDGNRPVVPMKEALQEELRKLDDQKRAIRLALVMQSGTFQQAIRYLDVNRNGAMSFLEFENGMHSLMVPWQRITRCRTLQEVFRLFDADKSGQLDVYELLGPEANVGEIEWKMMSTAEKWASWCDRSKREHQPLTRSACWLPKDHATAAERFMEEEVHAQRNRDEKDRVRVLFAKGERDVERLARHLTRANLTDDAISRARKEDLELVSRRGKKIKKMLTDVGNKRRELSQIVQNMDDLEKEKRQRLEEERRKAEEARRQEMVGGLTLFGGGNNASMKPSDDMLIHFFDEHSLVENDELEIRRLAREHGIAIPDAEAIKVHFDRYDVDSSGEIDKGEFRQMMQDMLHVPDLPEARVNEFWLFVDHDGSGSVNFEEFMCWFYPTFGAPRKKRESAAPKRTAAAAAQHSPETRLTEKRKSLDAPFENRRLTAHGGVEMRKV